MSQTRPTIGVFDSGFGGLTVLRTLLSTLPNADYVYIGDTARLPYGSKSAETVSRATLSAAHFLIEQGAEILVIACNTASALAMPTLQRELSIPVIGVIEPGAAAAANAKGSDSATDASVLVLATEATVASKAYTRACAAHGLTATEKACPLLVPLIEEGWIDHTVTEQVAEIYLREALTAIADAQDKSPSGKPTALLPTVLLLGCTHYPLLSSLLHRTAEALAPGIQLIDSADATAAHVALLLPQATKSNEQQPVLRFYATDSIQKFARLGSHFLGQDLGTVTLVSLPD